MENISKEPIDKIIKEIDNSQSNRIILAGLPGSGKSTVLESYQNNFNNSDVLLVNGTVNLGENLQIYDIDLIKLYHVTLIVYKLLNKIKDENKAIFFQYFNHLNTVIENIFIQIKIICGMHYYDYKHMYIKQEYLDYPEFLLIEFINILKECLDYKMITVLIDNFDVYGESNSVYQTFIYQVLASYIRTIITISTTNKTEDDTNRIIKLDYSYDVGEVRKILSLKFDGSTITNGNVHKLIIINNLLSDAIILEMIQKTNGNLFSIISLVDLLLKAIPTLEQSDYEKFLSNVLNDNLLNGPIITGQVRRERILHI